MLICVAYDDLDLEDQATLTDEELEDLTEADPQARQVVYSGQDFDVEGLVRRLERGDIAVPRFGHEDSSLETAGFQRGFVWRKPQMDRFIESLLLGFPIPGIFLVRQADQRYLVLDGQQRLITLSRFYSGLHEKREFALKNVSKRFIGLTYKSLPDELRRTLDNSFIQATIVDTDGSQSSLDSVYQIFERLNSGGTQLTPHEIRVALYAGDLVEDLESLNKLPAWRQLYGPRSPRIRDQELILRIVAMYVRSDQYSRPLKTFLNDFASDYRNPSGQEIQDAARLFMSAAETLLDGPGPRALRKSSPQVNSAQTEAIFVGLMRRLKSSEIGREELARALESLTDNKQFNSATSRSTADEEQVSTRLRLATAAFEGS
ncbi:hypothetical protein AYJ66_01145 [Dietzia cinnamea]|nr:hypothetical protein AYJ66_01145 [Dietzia cinnamea]